MTEKRKGFASPLQKAQAGKIGGGASQSIPTDEHMQAPKPEQEPEITKKTAKREETHFRQTVWMPIPLNRRLKIHAAKTGDDISGIINKLVEEFLDKHED